MPEKSDVLLEQPDKDTAHIRFATEPLRHDNNQTALYIPGPREREEGNQSSFSQPSL